MDCVTPNLQFSIICDDVIQDKRTGKFVLHGLFANISCSRIPHVHPRFFIVNGWCNGEGTFKQRTKVVSASNKTLIEDRYTEFELKTSRAKHTIIAQFNNVVFSTEGVYWIEIYLAEELVMRYPFEIIKISSKKAS